MAVRVVVTEYKGASVKTTIPELYSSKAIMAALRKTMRAAHNKATKRGIRILKDSIRLTGATSTKTILNSVTSRYVEGKHSTALQLATEIGWFSGKALDYVNIANYGRGPGKVNWPNILDWATRKGWSRGSAFGVYQKIKTHGSPGKHFIEDAEPKIDRERQELYDAALNRFVEEYNGRN